MADSDAAPDPAVPGENMKFATAMIVLLAVWPFSSAKEYRMTSGAGVPAATNYLVWVRPNGGEAVKQGAIGVDKNLTGELKTETVSRDFDVFITAEQGENATVPSSVEVLRAHVSSN